MSTTPSSVGALATPDSAPLVRRLVAVRDDEPSDAPAAHPVESFDLPGSWGLPPVDGDLVGVPVPCARARARYWFECTGSFRSILDHVPMSRARIALVDASSAGEVEVPFVPGPPSQQWVPQPQESDAILLARLLHAWPIGTLVVERRGLGFAPLYRPTAVAPHPPGVLTDTEVGRAARARAVGEQQVGAAEAPR